MKPKVIVSIKKLISVLICTTLISSTLPYNLLNYVVFAEEDGAATSPSDPDPSDPGASNLDSQDEGIYVHDLDSLKNAINNASNGDIITLTSNIEIADSATEDSNYCILNCSKNITIKSASGQKYTIYHRSPDSLLKITSGCIVNFENIIIDFGKTDSFKVNRDLIKVLNGSTLNLTSGTTLQNANVENAHTIYCEDNSNINIDQTSTITNLHSPYNGTIYADSHSTVNLDGTISNCSAPNGGAIYANDNSIVVINGTISNCTANADGGAIYSKNNSHITLSNSTFSGCHAENHSAGSIYVDSGEININNANISNSTSHDGGGAIKFDSNSTFNVNDITISECHSESGSGGAIYIGPGCTGSISNPTIIKCSSAANGGAIFFSNTSSEDSITIQEGTISECTSDHGGGIYVSRTDNVSVTRTSFFNNNANRGGTFYCTGSLTLQQVNISESKSTEYGDAIFLGNNATFLTPNNDSVISLSEDAEGINLPTYIYGYDGIYQSSKMPPDIQINTTCTDDSDQPYQPGDWANKHITVNFDFTGEKTNIDLEKTQISIDGQTFIDAISSSEINIINSTQDNLKFTILKDGEHNVSVRIYGKNGIYVQSDPISVKIDSNRPLPPTISDSDYSRVSTPTIWGTGEPECTVTATDENGNVIGTSIVDQNGEWEITTSPMQDGQHTISVIQTDKAGNQSDPITKKIIVDTTAPNGSISIGSNIFYEFLNTITFGLLFKDKTNVTISASDDSSSGIKAIEYLKTEKAYSTITEIIDAHPDWQTGTISNNSISFNIDLPPEQLNDKFFIYARITDNAENRSYIRSDGAIIYTDSVINTDEISYTKLDTNDKNLSVNLNGNTIFSITNGNHTLVKDTDYSIEDYRIILSHEYLNGLAAGDYELKINFAPAGETNLDPNLILPNSTVKLYVEKASQQLPPENAKFNNLNSSYTYGDTPGTISLNGGSGTGAVTYASTNPDVATINPTTGEITILKAGTFNIVATKAADENYEELIVTSDAISVNRRNVIISGIAAKSKIYDGNSNAEFDTTNAQIQNLVNNDQIAIIPGTASFSDKNVADRKTVSFAGFALTGNDAANYNLSAQPADATANISVKPLNILNIKIKDKVFDGSKTAEFDGNPVLEGLVNGDNVTLINGTPMFTNADIGSNILIEFSTPFSIEGTDSSNYSITQPSKIYSNIIESESGDKPNTSEDNTASEYPQSERNTASESPETEATSSTNEDDTVSGSFESEDTETGIQIAAQEGVIPPWCTLVVSEKPQDSNEHDKIYDKLDSEKKAIVESYKLYEIHLKDQDGNIVQPDASKGLVTVRIPVPDNYDLNELEIYRINEDTDDKFNGQVVKINNKSYYEYKTDHFSPYIIIDKNTMNDITQALFYYSVIILPLLLLALIIIILKKNKHKKQQ